LVSPRDWTPERVQPCDIKAKVVERFQGVAKIVPGCKLGRFWLVCGWLRPIRQQQDVAFCCPVSGLDWDFRLNLRDRGEAMRWLLSKRLRSYAMLAGVASLILNLALLIPSLYMLQVFDRVFSSRSEETLAMLSLLALVALALGYFVDSVRAE